MAVSTIVKKRIVIGNLKRVQGGNIMADKKVVFNAKELNLMVW